MIKSMLAYGAIEWTHSTSREISKPQLVPAGGRPGVDWPVGTRIDKVGSPLSPSIGGRPKMVENVLTSLWM